MFLAVLALICEAFATNFEAVGAMYLIILAFFSIMMICIRRVSWCGGVLTLLQWVIAIANVIFALTCPGNWTRNSQQVLVWMKDFVSMMSTRTLYQPDFKQKRQIIPDTGSRPAGIICRSLYAH